MSIVKGTNGLSLNVQRDYITLRTPNGNYTTSFGGAKGSGKLTNKAFKSIDTFVENQMKTKSPLDAMKMLLDEKVLTSLWSEWNEKVETNDFKIGDVVEFKKDCIFFKKYKGGEVKKVARKNVFIKVETTGSVTESSNHFH